MVKYIMAVDPGVTTGIATYNYGTQAWMTWQIPYVPIKLYEFFMPHIGSKVLTTVICERFDYRPVGKYDFGGSRAIPKVDLTAVRVIGLLELACAYAGNEIVWQSPSTINGDDGKKTGSPSVFWTDAKVKKLGLYKTTSVHSIDAVKHILHYRAFTLQETHLFEALHPGANQQNFKEAML